MSYRYALCALFLISTIHAMELENGQILVPEKLGQLAVIHHDNRFYVDKNGETKPVQNCFIDKDLRGISSDKLEKFLDAGYLSLSQMSDGEYSLKEHTRGNGGGPILGTIVYWGAKVVIYGGLAAGVATGLIIPEFGGNSVAAQRNAAFQANAITATAAEHYIAGEAASVGVGGLPVAVVATTIATTEMGRRVTQAGVAAIAAEGLGAASSFAAMVETIALAAGTAAGMAPTP